jgi:putative membrane protein
MRIHPMSALIAAVLLVPEVGCERRGGDRTSSKHDQKKDQKSGLSAISTESFLSQIAECNLAETAAAKEALERASNSDVRKFAQQMIDDHDKVDKELSDLSRRKGLALPDRENEFHHRELARLKEAGGVDVDRRYVAMVLGDHEKGVALLQDNATSAKDPEVRDFAQNAWPRCQGHLKTAQDLSGKLGSPPSAD